MYEGLSIFSVDCGRSLYTIMWLNVVSNVTKFGVIATSGSADEWQKSNFGGVAFI